MKIDQQQVMAELDSYHKTLKKANRDERDNKRRRQLRLGLIPKHKWDVS